MKGDLKYFCKHCMYSFYDENCEGEIKCPKCHATGEDIVMSVTKKDFENLIEIENLKIFCRDCKTEFTGEQLINNDYKCPGCNKKYNEDFVHNKIKKIEKRFACNYCNCMFSTEVFMAYNGSCPLGCDKLLNIEQWEDYKIVEFDGQIPEEEWGEALEKLYER